MIGFILIAFISIVISLSNLLAFFRAYKAAKITKKTLKHLKNAPKFSPDLVNCYVKFKGKVKQKNNYISPLTKVSCAFYSFFVIAHWTHKRKKPAKGTEPQKRLLFQDKSASELELIHESGKIVKLRWDDFLLLNKFHYWHTNKQNNTSIPTAYQDLAEAKFEKYESIENYLLTEEEVVVYGKLIRDSNNDLYITNPRIKQFPLSLKLINSGQSMLTALEKEINSTTRKRNLHASLFFVFALIAIVTLNSMK